MWFLKKQSIIFLTMINIVFVVLYYSVLFIYGLYLSFFLIFWDVEKVERKLDNFHNKIPSLFFESNKNS